MPDKSTIIDKLIQFGLNDVEAKIYLFLLNKPPQSILDITRGLEIPRTSVYDNSNKLIERGLVERIVRHKSQKLKAYPVSILENIVDKQATELKKLQQNFDFLKQNINLAINPQTATQVRYYQGPQGFKQMMSNALEAEVETIGYSVFGRVEVVGSQFYQRWVDDFKAKGLTDRVITNQLPETLHFINRDVHPGTHQLSVDNIKYVPSEYFYVAGDTTIYNNIFAVCYWKEGETVGVDIENAELVKTQKTIFEMLWAIAHPIKEVL